MSLATRRQIIRRRHHAAEARASADEVGEANADVQDPMERAICEVMTRNVVCVFEDFSIETLEELLLDRELSGVPVVDDDGMLVGFVAMTDIVRELHDRGDTSETATDDTLGWGFHEEATPPNVAQLMRPIALELPESCPVAKAIALMAVHHLHRVPVVSGEGELVGIVTTGDIVRFLARMGRPASKDPALDPKAIAEHDQRTEADRLMSLGVLADGVAHQINNALTPMRLSLGRLTSFELSRRPRTAERFHRIELLQDVREGLARVEKIIRELRTFSHTDETPSRALELSSVLDSAIGLAAHELRHHARLICDYGTVPAVRARAAELRQVFLNILVNAAHAIPEGEAHINEIRIATRTDDRGRAVIEIKDTGTGILPDDLARIFEPFFTAETERRGLGLGLAVARDVVAALGGEITIGSIVGKGTTVHVALPPCAEEGVAVDAAEPPPHYQLKLGERQRILIVDDDRPVAAAIALELADHDVVVAESGREALEILRRDHDFDVVLCDLMMPEVSGIDVYEALRLTDPDLLDRIVLMTGGAFTPRARQFLTEVDAPLIEKPFEPGQLHSVICAIERRREQHDAQRAITDGDPWWPSGTAEVVPDRG